MTPITRRISLSMLASALVLPAAGAGARVIPTVNPWAPRQLTAEEEARLRHFRHSVLLRSPALNDEAEFVTDHVRIRLEADQLFESNDTELHEAGVSAMTELAYQLDKFPDVRAEAVVHHHHDGQSYRSYIFTSRRAQSVVAALGSRTITSDRLLATGLGASFPIASNHTEPGRARNRRVEILIRPL